MAFCSRRASLLSLALLGVALPALPQPIQLNNPDGQRVVEFPGVAIGDRAGYSVSGAGDFNGDGLADIVIGAYRARRDEEPQGQAYVIFGTRDSLPPRLDLESLDGTNGFAIRGEQPGDLTGMRVAGIGDFNGDGIDDIAIAAPSATTLADEAGRVYIIFGSRGPFDPVLDLATLGSRGIVLEANIRGEAGRGLAGIGDFNGDGFADLAIGAPTTRNRYGPSAGRVYVVFGRDDWPERLYLDVLARDERGFFIEGRRGGDRAAWRVGGGGDFNGNGFPDLLVGAPRMFNPNPLDSGEGYIVYGGPGPHAFDLSLFYLNGDNGARVTGHMTNQWLGTGAASVGDLSGDGTSSMLFGASKSWPGGRPDGIDEGGQAYLLSSMSERQPAIIPVENPDILLLQHFNGPYAGDFLGWDVAGVGDTDGDGLPDFLLSAHAADPVDANAGRAYLVKGRRTGYLSRNNMRLFEPEMLEVFEGRGRWQIAGVSVSGVGDFNGDGLADFLIGAPGGSAREGDQIGRAFLVFGKRVASPEESTWVTWHRSGATPLQPVGGPGDPRVYPPDSRAWVAFDAGSGDGLQDASRTTVTRVHAAPSEEEDFATVHWRIEAERDDWQSATIRLKWLDSEVANLDVSTLRVIHRAGDDADWVELPHQTWNPAQGRVEFTTKQLGEFALKVLTE